jgi:tetratricopeptide (TPR) repeat protein
VKFFNVTILFLSGLVFTTSVFAQYNFDVLFSGARIAVSEGSYYDAIAKLNKCADLRPDNSEVYFYRGICKYSLFDNVGADRDLTMAIHYHSATYFDAYNYRSLTRYRLGKFSDAISDINKVIENKPNTPELYLERAYYYLSNANYADAINDCKKALCLKSLSEDGYICKAQAEEALSDFENAINDYNEVIKINPKNVDAYAFRGMTKFKMKNTTEAFNDFNLALKIDSTSTLAYYNRAEAEVKLGDTKDAMNDYNKVLQYEPRNSYAYFGRGALYANMQEYSKAIFDFNKVILINPNNIEALFNRGKLKYMVKDYKDAISDYDKIIFLFPYFTEAYYNRSQAKYELKDLKGAKKDMEAGKLMSEIFQSQNKETYNKDSLLLIKYTYLSADFHNTSDIKPDNVDNNFLPIFYFTEKDSINYKTNNYSLPLENFNWKNGQNLCLKNTGAFDKDSTLVHSIAKNSNHKTGQELLVTAIYKSNMQLFKEAKQLFDTIISADSLNAMAIFARGVNTCRKIDFENDNDDNSYVAENSIQEKLEKERKEKCNAALADFTKTIKLMPDFYFALYNRAYVKCLLSDFYGANFDYEQAIKKNPRFAEAYYNNGFLLYYLNLKQAACESFSKAGELGLKQAFSIIKKHCNGAIN